MKKLFGLGRRKKKYEVPPDGDPSRIEIPPPTDSERELTPSSEPRRDKFRRLPRDQRHRNGHKLSDAEPENGAGPSRGPPDPRRERKPDSVKEPKKAKISKTDKELLPKDDVIYDSVAETPRPNTLDWGPSPIMAADSCAVTVVSVESSPPVMQSISSRGISPRSGSSPDMAGSDVLMRQKKMIDSYFKPNKSYPMYSNQSQTSFSSGFSTPTRLSVGYEEDVEEYVREATGWLITVWQLTDQLKKDLEEPLAARSAPNRRAHLQEIRIKDLPDLEQTKDRLERHYLELEDLFLESCNASEIDNDLNTDGLNSAFKRLVKLVDQSERDLSQLHQSAGAPPPVIQSPQSDMMRIDQSLRSLQNLHQSERRDRRMDQSDRSLHLVGRSQRTPAGVQRSSINVEMERKLHKLALFTDGLESRLNGYHKTIADIEMGIRKTESCMTKADMDDLKSAVARLRLKFQPLEQEISGLYQEVDKLKANHEPRTKELNLRVTDVHQAHASCQQKLEAMELNIHSENIRRQEQQWLTRYETVVNNITQTCQDRIEWTDKKLKQLSAMEFAKDLAGLEAQFSKEEKQNVAIIDFETKVNECIKAQGKTDTDDQFQHMVKKLESNYQQLKDLSTGRLLDVDSLTAFVRCCYNELKWIKLREEPEVMRKWSQAENFDHVRIKDLKDHYKLLMFEIAEREDLYNEVHSKGETCIKSGHPGQTIIQGYLKRLHNQWEWLLNLTFCLELHLQDAIKIYEFKDKVGHCQNWFESQLQYWAKDSAMESPTNSEEAGKIFKELEEVQSQAQEYQRVINNLVDESHVISPLWMRNPNEPTSPAEIICDFVDTEVNLEKGQTCVIKVKTEAHIWDVDVVGEVVTVPSVIVRLLPPDKRVADTLKALQEHSDKLKKTIQEKQKRTRSDLLLQTMRRIQNWDLDQVRSRLECVHEQLETNVQEQLAEAGLEIQY